MPQSATIRDRRWFVWIKRLLDIAILFYLILIPVVIFTGGFQVSLLGATIRASHIYTPLKPLLVLVALRLVISVEIKNLILLTASLALGLVGLEAGIRLWDPPIAGPFQNQIHQPSPVYVWELKPGASGVGGFGEKYRIDERGFRVGDRRQALAPDAKRIAVIGDSFTFGPSVNAEETYPAQLEQALTQRGEAAEVINCGVTGYNMWHYIEVLRRRVLPLKPDLVVLGVFFNDIGESPPPGYGTPGFTGLNPFLAGRADSLLERSALFNLLRNLNFLFEGRYRYRRGHGYLQGIEERHRHLGPENPDSGSHKILYGEAAPEIYAGFEDEMRRFADIARQAGVPVLVAMIPDAGQLHHPDSQAVNRIVARTAANLELPFVDLTPALERAKDPRTLYLFPRDPHNSPAGYRIIGETLAQAIVDRGLL